MKSEDPVKEFLRERGCSGHIVERGLDGLVESWQATAQAVAAGYAFGLDDYLNDLDTRQLIADSLVVATNEQRQEFLNRIRQADAQMKDSVELVDGCLWGWEVAEEEGWTPESNWWYFSRPLSANVELLAEIDGVARDQ